MWIQFYLQHAFFSLHIFTFLVFTAVAWLYADAWTNKKKLKEGLRSAGFFIAGVSYFLSALSVETQFFTVVILLVRIAGFSLISASLTLDPLQPVPKTEGITPQLSARKKQILPALFFPAASVPLSLLLVLAVLPMGATAVLWFRRATTGLERHLFPLAVSFCFFVLSQLVSLRQLLLSQDSLVLYELVRPYGILWGIEYLLLALGTFILAKWIFHYLIKRIETELTLILTTVIVLIFLSTTILFTALLVRQIRQTVFTQLTSDAAVLLYAIESKQGEVAAEVTALAQSEQLKVWTSQANRQEILPLLATTMKAKQLTSLVITNAQGSIVANGETPEVYGIAIADDYFLQQAKAGNSYAGLITRDGVSAPILLIKAIAPLMENNQVIGTVLATYTLDSAFLRGVKAKTGLESSLFANNSLAATSITNRFQETPPLGMLETNTTVLRNVLSDQTAYTGVTRFFSVTYLSAYLPLRDTSAGTLGMLSVGKPERQIIDTAQHSIRFTFLFTSLLIAGSLIPAYQIGAMIRKQLK